MVRWFKYNIIPSYAFLSLGRYFGIISNELCFILVTLILGIMIIKAKKITIPHVKGMWFYTFYAVILVIIGLAFFVQRNILRDIFYIFPTIEFVILGYYYQRVEDDKDKLLKSVIYVGTCIAIINIIFALTSPSELTSLVGIRRIFTSNCYEVVMASIVAFVISITNTKCKIKYLKYIQILLLLDIVLSFSRSAWIEFLLGCFVVVILSHKRGTLSTRVLRVVTGSLAVLLLFILVGQYIMPESVITGYLDKLFNSSTEINAGNTFNSVEDATKNWRAYEIQSAINGWQNGNIFQRLFGYGLGKGIYIHFVPATWQSMVENHSIPLLHSAYHTYLVKGGIIGLISLIWFMLAPAYDSFKRLRRIKRKNSSENISLNLILIGICVAFLVQSYVVRGPIVQNANISWAMLVGWISACFWKESNNENNFE